MSRQTLTAEPRDASGKSPVARRLRSEGKVPGTLYARETEPISFAVNLREISAIMRRGSTLIELQLGGDTHTGVIKDYQVHPVRGELVHLDMQLVRMDEDIRTVAPIVLLGEPVGKKAGGVLTQGVTELNISCRPDAIPETIEIDVTELGPGGTLMLTDVTPPKGVELLDDPNTMIASISVPRGLTAAEEAGQTPEQAAEAEAAADEAGEGGEEASSE